MNVRRSALMVLGLFLLAGCGFDRLLGPLEIDVTPLDLTRTLPSAWRTHVAYFSNVDKLINECGPGMKSVEEAYERRIADMVDPDKIRWTYNETIDPVIEDAMMRCLEERPDLVPKECKHRMVLVRGKNLRARGGDGGVGLQCGDSAILPLEVRIFPLDPAKKTQFSKIWGTHVATYSDLDKMLDECGPGAERSRHLAVQSDDDLWDAFGRIVDNALAKCLEERDLIPEACRHRMTPLHDSPVRSFEPRVHFLCGDLANGVLSE